MLSFPYYLVLGRGYSQFVTQFNIPLDKAEATWKEAIQRKGLVVAFNERILEEKVFDCCYPSCLKIMLPPGEVLPFSYIEGIEIPNPLERKELLASC